MDWSEDLTRSGCTRIDDESFARYLDTQDPLQDFKNDFCLAGTSGRSIYLCGNSLGLMPKRTEELIRQELKVWSERAVEGHFDHPYGRPWVSIDDHVVDLMARIVGAQKSEVAVCGTLTGNLHSMLATFYRPKGQRTKIYLEDKAFPSDHYAIESQIQLRGLDAKSNMILARPRPDEWTLRTEDILETIDRLGEEIALVMFSGVQYYTGQFFEMEAITRAAQKKGCLVGWNLAHAAGNVELKLHDWNVDFAVWCSYKYLNAGPGGIASLFVHDRHGSDTSRTREAGWWGHDKESRFQMALEFNPIPGAQGYQVSNPGVLLVVSLLGSLETFQRTTMAQLAAKSRRLTGYLERLLHDSPLYGTAFEVITPRDPGQRGAQLSLLFKDASAMESTALALHAADIVIDQRKPNVIRISPTPLYNGYLDVLQCARHLS